MTTVLLANLERMLAQGQEGALLRYGLGSEYLKISDFAQATQHLQVALAHTPDYSAAWKLLGQALTGTGDLVAARAAYASGITAAEHQGDIQAAREMRVFLKRLERPDQA